jgi:hypothetical protein
MEKSRKEKISTLKSIFQDLSLSILEEALEQSDGNLKLAIDKLLKEKPISKLTEFIKIVNTLY